MELNGAWQISDLAWPRWLKSLKARQFRLFSPQLVDSYPD